MAAVQHVRSPDGTRIAFRVAGEGEPIVLVHGAGTSSIDWVPVLPLLRSRFTVVTMDRRGRGASADGRAYAIEREAEDVLAVLDAVGAELLVGHSYGALCSIVAAGSADRLRRLILYEPPIAVAAMRLDELEELIAAGRLDAAVEGFLTAAGAQERHLAAIRSSPAWPGLREAALRLPRELRAAAAWRAPAQPIAVPTLLVLGGETRSSVYLDGLDDLEAAFGDLRRATLPGQLHVGHVFAAPAFAELIAGFCGAGDPARVADAGRRP